MKKKIVFVLSLRARNEFVYSAHTREYRVYFILIKLARRWWYMPLFLALRRQRFKANLVSRASSRTARLTERNSVSNNNNKKVIRLIY